MDLDLDAVYCLVVLKVDVDPRAWRERKSIEDVYHGRREQT
jgi:hypothetical protein